MISRARSERRRRRHFGQAVLAGAMLATGAVLLSGCSSGGLIGDRMPAAVGGLPQDAPARPVADGNYPAVHNMPPARADTTLNNDQQKALADDLVATRNRYGNGAAADSKAGSAPNP